MTWKPDPEYKESNERIVCAACRNSMGLIITGARHLDPTMRRQMKLIRKDLSFRDPDNQGFINQWGEFLTRREAWVIAEKQGQILKRCGGDGEKLYSENLY